MKLDRCSFCKGNLHEGKTEFVAKVGDEVISIKDVPTYICENCVVVRRISCQRFQERLIDKVIYV